MKSYHYIIFSVLFALLFPAASLAEIDINEGLYAHWTFDNDSKRLPIVSDESDQINTGYLINGPTLANGIIGKGINFDGQDDYIDVPANGSLNLTKNFSVTIWFKGSGPLISKGVFCSTPKSWLFTVSDKEIMIYYGGSDSVMSAGISLTEGFDLNKWHHAAMVCTDNRIAFYLDGFLAGTRSLENSIEGNNKDLVIGAGQCLHEIIDNYFVFSGTIDEIRIYNRVLKSSEVAYIYNEDFSRKERST